MPDAPDSPALRRFRRVAVGLVAVAFLVAGGSKLLRPDPNLSMLSRYLPSPQAQKAAACLEIALALWLLSGSSPKLAPGVAAGAMVGLAVLTGGELRRDRPLPCGCFPTRVTPGDTTAVRRDLAIAIGRNTFLAMVCVGAIVAVPRDEPDGD